MKKTAMKVLAGALAFALTITVAPVPSAQAAKKVALDKKKLTITVGKSKKLKLKNNKQKVNWKITSGKKNVRLKAKKKTSVQIVAKKKGSAKVQAVVGKKKYTCKVTVKAKKPVVTKAPEATVASTPTLTPTPSPTPTIEPTVEPTPEPTENPEDALDSEDVKNLRALIATLKEAGATVSEDILDDMQYSWDEDEGYLSAIYWSSVEGVSISGELVFPAFSELYTLNVAGTEISSLDVSKCDVLEELDCSDCENLTNLDVSGCVELYSLDCSGCEKLTSLDVSACGWLESLDCRDTAIKTLDLSKCPYMDKYSVDGPDDLEIIWWNRNEDEELALEALVESLIENNNAPKKIADIENEDYYYWDADGYLSEISWEELGLQGEISLTAFTHLTSVDIYDNALTSLDLSGCSKLEALDCSNQEDDDGYTLVSLNLKGCSALTELYCSGCALTELDLSDCKNLDINDSESFECDYYGVDIIPPGGNLGGDDFDI